VRCVSCRQEMVAFCFLMLSMSFNWRIETIVIVSYIAIPVTLLFFYVWFFPNPHWFIYLSSEIYSFSYFHGCIYLPLFSVEDSFKYFL
jgi:hypothetical protein